MMKLSNSQISCGFNTYFRFSFSSPVDTQIITVMNASDYSRFLGSIFNDKSLQFFLPCKESNKSYRHNNSYRQYFSYDRERRKSRLVNHVVCALKHVKRKQNNLKTLVLQGFISLCG